MMLLGCKPAGRYTEQHDIFFTISPSLKGSVPGIMDFWPEANGKIHIDAWREVTQVEGYSIEVVKKEHTEQNQEKLFFINLGGYREGEFDEPHYKMLIVAPDLAAATLQAKQSAFYRHTGFQGAVSHIDDKYGVDVDDAFEILDILPAELKSTYRLKITKTEEIHIDEIHLGYLPIGKINS